MSSSLVWKGSGAYVTEASQKEFKHIPHNAYYGYKNKAYFSELENESGLFSSFHKDFVSSCASDLSGSFDPHDLRHLPGRKRI